ncbi:cupin domain-containing protein [Rhizobium sp. C4]|uniref:cupin domain-containing protein n=1 Tax=Rhizobium sp. C4 TaxID=1349800 RepID=UPI001E4932E2|nr:cupin domain-containing protein [Rhizobium sp. C4]MCD2173218.1 cupin domain-containing protein [Rhizobium sp. C4]
MNMIPFIDESRWAGTPPVVHFLGNILTFVADCEKTGGSFTLTECKTAPGAGAPPHTQEDEEAFIVLEGAYQFLIGDRMETHSIGSVVHIKPGMVHAFSNQGDKPARMLILNLPGGMHEGFFRAVGDPVRPGQTEFADPGPPNVELLCEVASRYGIRILPPPAAA